MSEDSAAGLNSAPPGNAGLRSAPNRGTPCADRSCCEMRRVPTEAGEPASVEVSFHTPVDYLDNDIRGAQDGTNAGSAGEESCR